MGNTDVHIGVNLAPKCRKFLLVRTADMCIAHVRVMSVSVDMSIAWGILMYVHMGVNLAPKCRNPECSNGGVLFFSLFIAGGILMFIWGET